MKAITLTQPWAMLVALGSKKIETRSWSTSYRGPLAIHAAKGYPRDARNLCITEPFFSELMQWGEYFDDPPRGVVIAKCNLVGIEKILSVEFQTRISRTEKAFGDYTPGRYAWFLEDVQPFGPYPAKGALGLWDWVEPEMRR